MDHRLLMEKPDGTLVFVGCVQGAWNEWQLTESTPLPEGTILGVENFTHSLGIPSRKYYDCVSVEPCVKLSPVFQPRPKP